MKLLKITVFILFFSVPSLYSQLGWEPYTGQPTQTLYGSVAGAGLGYMLAPAISNGPDAQWIGALVGMGAGGLLANYMAGDNITHQKLQNYENQSNSNNSQKQKNIINVQQGIRLSKNQVQSPYSNYVVLDVQPGSIIADPLSGELFSIPK